MEDFTFTINEEEFINLEQNINAEEIKSLPPWGIQFKIKQGIVNVYSNSKNKSKRVVITGKQPLDTLDKVRIVLTKYNCFFAMEYNDQNNEVFAVISNYLFNEKRIRLVRIDAEAYLGSKDEQLERNMNNADFAFVNISDNNVNVFYELGYLIAKLGEKNVIIMEDGKMDRHHNCNYICCKYKNSWFNIRQKSRIIFNEMNQKFLGKIKSHIDIILKEKISTLN